jgi:hypothetical protein
MKVSPKNLFKTFIISVIIGIAINCIYYSISQKGNGYDYGHAVPLIIVGSLFINVISIIMSLPALFLNYPALWANLPIRLLLYFCGAILLFITLIFGKMNNADKTFYLLTCAVFIIVHTVFYYKAIKNNS